MRLAADFELKSVVAGANWPAIPSPEGAALLALQYQFEHSQWWSPAKLEAIQFRQLREVLVGRGHRIVGTVPKRHAFGSSEVGEWTVLVFDLDSLPELRSE